MASFQYIYPLRCPYCGAESALDVTISISGQDRPASYDAPAEYTEIESEWDNAQQWCAQCPAFIPATNGDVERAWIADQPTDAYNEPDTTEEERD